MFSVTWATLKIAPNPFPFESTVLIFVKTVGKWTLLVLIMEEMKITRFWYKHVQIDEDWLQLAQHRTKCWYFVSLVRTLTCYLSSHSWGFLINNKPTRCTNFSNLFLQWDSTCFGQFLCPSSGVFHCTHSNGICHTGLLTYTIAVCTEKNSWCWTDELSETCRFSFPE